jgi:pimeloyl-ACP methyl ester carboxylesterase
MRITFCLLALPIALAAVFVGCSEDTPNPINTSPAGDGGADSGVVSLDSPSVPCTDVAADVYGDPGSLSADPSARGNIIKCAKEADLTKDAIQAKATEVGYAGKPLTSAANVYRVSYRTERGDTAGTPGVSSALVYVPKTPRAAKLPVIVAGRGSRGQAAKCAATKLDESLAGINGDFYRLVYPLVGSGYAVILPDLAGYANFGAAGNPMSAYAQAADVARSTLDGSRALKKLFPGLDDKVVLVGHSQGGHSVLASLALAESYGAAGPIVATVAFAPLWLSQRSWGAILYGPAGHQYPIATSTYTTNISVWYHYTQAELLDGPGEGKKLFKADKQEAIENFAKNDCWGSNTLASLGATYVEDLFESSFVGAVAISAAIGSSCSTDVCTKWIDRYTADRPHITGAAAQVPILVAYGMKDTTIPTARMRCALDRLKEDNTKLTVCVDPDKDHGGIVSGKGEYVADWIGNVALGEPAPAACAANESLITDACATPPPND